MMNLKEIFFPSKYRPNTQFKNLLKFDIIIVAGSAGTGKSYLSNLIMENSSRYTHIGETDFITRRIDENTLKNEIRVLVSLKKPFLLECQIISEDLLKIVNSNKNLKKTIVQFNDPRGYRDIPKRHYRVK